MNEDEKELRQKGKATNPGLRGQVRVVERPVEGLRRLGLVGRVVVGLQEGVGESISGGDSGAGVEDEHLLEKVNSWKGGRDVRSA